MSLKKIFFLLSALLFIFLIASCSTPAYKQNKINKHKRVNRSKDCGCLNNDTNINMDLCYYEEK